MAIGGYFLLALMIFLKINRLINHVYEKLASLLYIPPSPMVIGSLGEKFQSPPFTRIS